MKFTYKVNEKEFDVDSNASPSEILERAQVEGIELTDEQLEQVSAGFWGGSKTMPSHITMSFPCDNCAGVTVEAKEEDVALGYVDCPTCHTRYMLR